MMEFLLMLFDGIFGHVLGDLGLILDDFRVVVLSGRIEVDPPSIFFVEQKVFHGNGNYETVRFCDPFGVSKTSLVAHLFCKSALDHQKAGSGQLGENSNAEPLVFANKIQGLKAKETGT